MLLHKRLCRIGIRLILGLELDPFGSGRAEPDRGS